MFAKEVQLDGGPLGLGEDTEMTSIAGGESFPSPRTKPWNPDEYPCIASCDKCCRDKTCPVCVEKR